MPPIAALAGRRPDPPESSGATRNLDGIAALRERVAGLAEALAIVARAYNATQQPLRAMSACLVRVVDHKVRSGVVRRGEGA